jgi:hypothetical protein
MNVKHIAAYVFAALAAVTLFASGAFWSAHKGRLDTLESVQRNQTDYNRTTMEMVQAMGRRVDALEHRLGRGQGATP